jgi:hypothetical protein
MRFTKFLLLLALLVVALPAFAADDDGDRGGNFDPNGLASHCEQVADNARAMAERQEIPLQAARAIVDPGGVCSQGEPSQFGPLVGPNGGGG